MSNPEPTFCVNTLVAQVLSSYVQTPDYSELREDIEKHAYARLRLKTDACDKDGYWYKILFTTSDCAVVQDVLLTWRDTRFAVHKVPLADWTDVFVEWMDEDHNRYDDCHYEYQRGMRSWGADV